jgi:tRNA threonylcarbamoyladenosine biosynthesis protein TsaB
LPTFALDTSTASPALALVGDDGPIAELWLAPEPGAGRRVLEAVHGLLASVGATTADVDGIVVGVGPGGFTGLRIGLATALGLGQALGVPVTGASSLEALALGLAEAAPPGASLVPVLDARRRELFAAVYRPGPDDALEEMAAPQAIAPADLAALLDGLGAPAVIGGDGVPAAGGALDGPGRTLLPPPARAARLSAAALVARVRAGGGLPARPVYARLPDAEVNRRAAIAAAGS